MIRRLHSVSVAIAEGRHPVPYRTRKLSPPAPMVLPGKLGGRVGRRRDSSRSAASMGGASSFPGPDVPGPTCAVAHVPAPCARWRTTTRNPTAPSALPALRPEAPAAATRRVPAGVTSRVVPPGVVARPAVAGVRRDPIAPPRPGDPGPGAGDPLRRRDDPVPVTGNQDQEVGDPALTTDDPLAANDGPGQTTQGLGPGPDDRPLVVTGHLGPGTGAPGPGTGGPLPPPRGARHLRLR